MRIYQLRHHGAGSAGTRTLGRSCLGLAPEEKTGKGKRRRWKSCRRCTMRSGLRSRHRRGRAQGGAHEARQMESVALQMEEVEMTRWRVTNALDETLTRAGHFYGAIYAYLTIHDTCHLALYPWHAASEARSLQRMNARGLVHDLAKSKDARRTGFFRPYGRTPRLLLRFKAGNVSPSLRPISVMWK